MRKLFLLEETISIRLHRTAKKGTDSNLQFQGLQCAKYQNILWKDEQHCQRTALLSEEEVLLQHLLLN